MKKKNIDYTNWSKDELIKELKRIKETTYGLVWHRDVPQEKIDVLINPDARTPEEMFANEVTGKPFPVLKEVKSKEVVSDKNDQTHILIEGDNYHSLVVLNFTHQEVIDVIYIDPPYNTGSNDFLYNDSFVIKEDPYRHSKWLSFMEKRLKLAKNLLKKDGVIFISIDDNEFAQLKLLCDEIFEEKNFIANFIWEKHKSPKNDNKGIAVNTEYIICFAKDIEKFKPNLLPRSEKNLKGFKNPDNDSRGFWIDGPLLAPTFSQNAVFEIIAPNGKIHLPPAGKCWSFNKDGVKRLLDDGRIWFGKTGNNVPRIKRFQSELADGLVPTNMLNHDEVGGNQFASRSLKEIFSGEKVFDYSKPYTLLEHILKIAANKSAIVLDFFAGSGTTGHAVLKLNSQDGGTRQFILCTNNENEIATGVCQPRLEKVIKGHKNSRGEKIEGLGGNLKYFSAYDFVESEPSDKNKHKLVNKCTEMLCIKEGIYDPVVETDDYKILKSHDNRYLGIIFYEDAIDEYKKAIKKIDATINTYVFSLGDDPHTAQFADVADKVALQAIPEIILKVYQEIFR